MSQADWHIRPAAPDDVARLKEVFRSASLSNEDDRELLAVHPEFLDWEPSPDLEARTRVALHATLIVGFVTGIRERDELRIDDLFVDPEWTRQGAAIALVEYVCAEARRDGVRGVVVDGNRHALAFYRSAGFIEQREVALEHGTAIHLRRELCD